MPYFPVRFTQSSHGQTETSAQAPKNPTFRTQIPGKPQCWVTSQVPLGFYLGWFLLGTIQGNGITGGTYSLSYKGLHWGEPLVSSLSRGAQQRICPPQDTFTAHRSTNRDTRIVALRPRKIPDLGEWRCFTKPGPSGTQVPTTAFGDTCDSGHGEQMGKAGPGAGRSQRFSVANPLCEVAIICHEMHLALRVLGSRFGEVTWRFALCSSNDFFGLPW